ncbi:hypothetical protein T440DRAFT_484470, partial [Plenodomus tracheiphilus IPT5]
STAFMNAWNPEFCAKAYETQSVGFLSKMNDGRVNLNPAPIASAIRELVGNQEVDPYAESTYQTACRTVASQAQKPSKLPFLRPTFGYVAQWVSELGNEETLSGLLKHADLFMKPTWSDGGLFYSNVPRGEHEQGNWTSADPFTGNAALGYARLNVFNGQRKMWLAPWTPKQVDEAPFVDNLTYASNVDVLRASWDQVSKAMVLTLRTWNGKDEIVSFEVCNLPAGSYGLYKNGVLSETRGILAGSAFELTMRVTPKDLDIVLLSQGWLLTLESCSRGLFILMLNKRRNFTS